MRAITTLNLRIAFGAIVLGIAVGAFGFVRTGALLIAAGTAVIVLARSSEVKGRRRIIESYLPLAIAGVLFALALALPKGL
jgi:cation transport ATPase